MYLEIFLADFPEKPEFRGSATARNIRSPDSTTCTLLPAAAGTKHRSQALVLPVQKVSQTLVKANLRPKNFCLGLIRPKVSFYKCLGYFLYW